MAWFKRFLHSINWDPGVLVAFILATLAAWPLLTRVSLPAYTDAEMHAFRTYQLLVGWQAGVPYLRWAPDLFFAYGYPVFNYYAPLSYYVGAAYSALIGDSGVAGVKFVLVLSCYLGAWGMYLFVRDRWGALAGVVSAAALLFAPYKIYIDPHARGDAPETLAIALAPLMLWAFARLRRTASPGDAALAALLLAGVIVSHNLMALVFFAILIAWLAWDVVFGQLFLGAWIAPTTPTNGQTRGKVVVMLALAVGLGLCLSAVMWLPAVLERDAVQFRNVASGTYFDFRRYFIDVTELFAPPLTFDFGATQMPFNYSVGVSQAVLGLAGLLTVFVPRLRRLSVIFFGLLALACIYFMLPASQQVWEAIPPMAFMQFPYRFLGPTAVALGILAGAALGWADLWPWKQARLVVACAAIVFCVVPVLPLMYPPQWPDYGVLDARRILATELDGRGLGTTSANDFLPVQVVSQPGPQAAVLESYDRGMPDKVNRATLPTGTQVTPLRVTPEHFTYRVTGDTEFVFRQFTFYFPGWTAYVDGQAVPITPSEPEGWMTFWVPAGDHQVELVLENTAPRWAGWGLTGAALLGLVALVVWRTRLPVERPKHDLLPRPAALSAGLVIVALLGVRWLADQNGWWWVQSTGNDVLVAQHTQFAELEDNLALLAYDLSATTLRPGEMLRLNVYWKTLAPPQHNYRVFVHLIGPDGQLWGQSDKWNPQDFPIGRWPLDRYVRDEHQALVRADAPPGEYHILVGLWDGDTGVRLRVVDSGADSVTLDVPVRVVHP